MVDINMAKETTDLGKPFVPELRLVINASIPLPSEADGQAEYNNLKIFLQAISKNVIITAHIIEILEPCCAKPPKERTGNHENS